MAEDLLRPERAAGFLPAGLNSGVDQGLLPLLGARHPHCVGPRVGPVSFMPRTARKLMAAAAVT